MEDMMGGIAAAAMDMKATQLQENYSASMLRRTMDTAQMEAQKLLEMMPQIPKGQYVDVYA